MSKKIAASKANINVATGYGQFDTNCRTGITYEGVQALVDNPQQVDKGAAQWLIPSTLPSRAFKEQEANGEYLFLWADIDKDPPELREVADALDEATDVFSYYEIYTTRSAREDCQKCRIIIPLDVSEGGGTDKYFKRLFDGSERRVDALAHYLLNRTIGADFMPRGNAPMTGAKAQMTSLAVSPEREALEDAIDTHRCPVINENIIDITTLTDYAEMEPGEPLPKGRTLAKILSELGYEKIEQRVVCNKTRRRHRIWVRPDRHPEALIEEVGAFLNDPSYVPF